MAPIQRVIGDAPLVNPVQRFREDLGAWRDPSFLAPLAHIVHADEPSGSVAEIATPAPSHTADAPPLPLAVLPAPTPRGSRAPVVQRAVFASAPAATAPPPV
ncbi:MAG TPA: hypothetical protein VH442_09980, partial [Micromonosporaceae bacterium]